MSQPRQIEYLGVVAGDEFLSERGAHLRIPRFEVQSIDFRYGSPARHPLLMVLFGLVAVALGLYGAARFVQWFQGAPVWPREALLVALLVLGGYALYEAVQRAPLLIVRTARGTRRLELHGTVKQEELQEFLRRLETELGYPVRSSPQGPA
jgi:hypothetical protein